MSIAQQNPPPEAFQKTPLTARRNGRWAGFRYLLRARMLELAREREVAFWIFVFPLLLALGLGFAFRNKPANRTTIAIVAGPEAQNILTLIENSSAKGSIRAEVIDQERAKDGLRLGKYDLVVEPVAAGRVQYDYDPARPESVLSHAEVDHALQSAAGRTDVLSTRVVESSEPGSRYIDFLV